MRKRYLKSIAVVFALTTVLVTSVPVFGTENSITVSGSTSSVKYNLDVGQTFKLAIPKGITLVKNGDGDYNANYSVKMISCDITSNKQVEVSSDASFNISRNAVSDTALINNDMDVTVDGIQSKIIFTGKLQNKIYDGYMNAGKLKSGSWNTNTTFTVAIADKT